jgi:hypothetical protein
MDFFSKPARATTLVIILALVPTSGGFAQAHKGKHQGNAKAKQPATAAHPAKAMTPPQTTKANPQTTSAHSTTMSHQPTKSSEELLAALHSTRTLLTQANHDPLGHKTRALQEVGNAIKLLSTQTKGSRTGQTSTTPTKSTSIGQTSPATSEADLTEAQKQLQSVESEMAGEGVNAHQITRARNSVQNAIRELNLALVDR